LFTRECLLYGYAFTKNAPLLKLAPPLKLQRQEDGGSWLAGNAKKGKNTPLKGQVRCLYCRLKRVAPEDIRPK